MRKVQKQTQMMQKTVEILSSDERGKLHYAFSCVRSKGPFTLSDCESEREIFLLCFMLLDVNSSIEITITQLFATSLSGNWPYLLKTVGLYLGSLTINFSYWLNCKYV